jgi:hypothetical protein
MVETREADGEETRTGGAAMRGVVDRSRTLEGMIDARRSMSVLSP